jgi:acyl carrier protein
MRHPEDEIRPFMATRIRERISDDDDIFALGFVNSLFAIELVVFLEKTFGIRISNDDLTLDNFRTIRSMAAVVERQLASSARA